MAVPQRSRAPRAPQASDDAPRAGSTRSRAAAKTGKTAVKKAKPDEAKVDAPQAAKAAPSAGQKAGRKPGALPSFDELKQAFTQPAEAMASMAKAIPGMGAAVNPEALQQAFKIPGMPAMPTLSELPGLASLSGLPQWPSAPGVPGTGAEALKQWMGRAAEPLAAMGPMKDAAEAMGQSLGATLQSLAGLKVPPTEFQRIQQEYMQQASSLWNQAIEQPGQLKPADRRFAAPEWSANPVSAFTASMYLLNAKTMSRLADSLQGDEKARERVRFAVQQFVDAASPSNFLALNPEALKKAVETKGESITQGVQHLLHDLRQGHLSQTDESVFHVGQNVATSAGSVVYENAFFQLIEYAPLTPKVHERPFLFVPPCINKYYILDLQPDNSLVRYVVSQGHRVFMVSWVNADDSLAKADWDDYVQHGVIEAMNKTLEISGADQLNALGFCVGGTLLATALATLAARGEKPAASLTLLTTYLDFVNTGIMDVFVDEMSVRTRELTMGPNSPKGGGLMKGVDLASTFSFLRANDLVWNYVVGNYLKGETPPAFDLLYWNSDSTNLPGPFYTWYLRNTYLENKLVQPGAVKVCGEPLDLSLIDIPTFIYASREDHIVPWDSAYASTQVLSGDLTFVLGASGHIAGVINPPEKKKRSHWTTSPKLKQLPDTSEAWFATAEEHAGSWWPVWSDWLSDFGGQDVPAPKAQGSRAHPPIEAAPGRYVLRKV